MKLIIAALLLSFSYSPAFALDNSTKNSGKWSRCKLDCDNAGGPPVLIKACKEACDKNQTNTTLKGQKGTLKTIDQNAPVLTPDN